MAMSSYRIGDICLNVEGSSRGFEMPIIDEVDENDTAYRGFSAFPNNKSVVDLPVRSYQPPPTPSATSFAEGPPQVMLTNATGEPSPPSSPVTFPGIASKITRIESMNKFAAVPTFQPKSNSAGFGGMRKSDSIPRAHEAPVLGSSSAPTSPRNTTFELAYRTGGGAVANGRGGGGAATATAAVVVGATAAPNTHQSHPQGFISGDVSPEEASSPVLMPVVILPSDMTPAAASSHQMARRGSSASGRRGSSVPSEVSLASLVAKLDSIEYKMETILPTLQAVGSKLDVLTLTLESLASEQKHGHSSNLVGESVATMLQDHEEYQTMPDQNGKSFAEWDMIGSDERVSNAGQDSPEASSQGSEYSRRDSVAVERKLPEPRIPQNMVSKASFSSQSSEKTSVEGPEWADGYKYKEDMPWPSPLKFSTAQRRESTVMNGKVGYLSVIPPGKLYPSERNSITAADLPNNFVRKISNVSDLDFTPGEVNVIGFGLTSPKPYWYFFYGTFTEPTLLQHLLALSEPPTMELARVWGRRTMYFGPYPCAVEGEPNDWIDGRAWFVPTSEAAEFLKMHESDNYREATAEIELKNGEKLFGTLFEWAGDKEQLCDMPSI